MGDALAGVLVTREQHNKRTMNNMQSIEARMQAMPSHEHIPKDYQIFDDSILMPFHNEHIDTTFL